MQHLRRHWTGLQSPIEIIHDAQELFDHRPGSLLVCLGLFVVDLLLVIGKFCPRTLPAIQIFVGFAVGFGKSRSVPQ